MAATQSKWMKLKSLPDLACVRGLKQLNDDIFICVHYSDGIRNGTPCSYLDIQKYSTISDEWSTDSYIINKQDRGTLLVATDKTNQCCYIYRTNGDLFEINLKSNSIQHILSDVPQYMFPQEMLCIDGKIIVLEKRMFGFIVDTRNNMKITAISRSGITNAIIYEYILTSKYIQSSDYILNLIDIDGKISVYKCSLSDNKFTETDVRIPNIENSQGYALSKCERYLIMFGGGYLRRPSTLSDHIVLFDIQKHVLIKCGLKCPVKGQIEAINMRNEAKDRSLVQGYIRELWQLPQFKEDLGTDFPIALVNILCQRVFIEYIHIISRSGVDRLLYVDRLKHWKINIDDIFDSIVVD